VAGAICGSAQIVTDIGVGSDDWLAIFLRPLSVRGVKNFGEYESKLSRRVIIPVLNRIHDIRIIRFTYASGQRIRHKNAASFEWQHTPPNLFVRKISNTLILLIANPRRSRALRSFDNDADSRVIVGDEIAHSKHTSSANVTGEPRWWLARSVALHRS